MIYGYIFKHNENHIIQTHMKQRITQSSNTLSEYTELLPRECVNLVARSNSFELLDLSSFSGSDRNKT